MAEQSAIAAPFPAPPPFYKHFTKQNLSALRQLRKEAGVPQKSNNDQLFDEGRKTADIDVRSLPAELRYLVPPEPPITGKYTSFGIEIDRNAPEATLAAAGIEQVYPSHPSVRLNPQPHLIALARSLLASFLALTGVLSANPELYQEKTQDLQTLMYNMHDLVNQYRPHQARETLILLMEERVEKMKRENQAIEDAKEKIAKMLDGLQRDGVGRSDLHADIDVHSSNLTKQESVLAKQKSRQMAAFDALEDELG